MSQGIDYSCGRGSNTEVSTGFRYGVIQANHTAYWYDSSEAHYPEPETNEEGEEIEDNDFAEPTSFFIKDEDYQAEQSAESPDIFVFKSKFYTYAKFCSPCCPGACSLDSPIKPEDVTPDMKKSYCFGLDMFDETLTCPYSIYEVETNKLIYTPKEETES